MTTTWDCAKEGHLYDKEICVNCGVEEIAYYKWEVFEQTTGKVVSKNKRVHHATRSQVAKLGQRHFNSMWRKGHYKGDYAVRTVRVKK